MKRTICLLLVMSMAIYLAGSVYATEVTLNRLSEMSVEECAEFLSEYNVEIPGGRDNLDYWAEFIMEAIRIVENNPESTFYCAYSWTTSRDFGEQIATAVRAYYGKETVASVASTRSIYSLQDSTVYGSWSESYLNYNCYAYALGITSSAFNPGRIIYGSLPSLSKIVEYVESDLNNYGYNCVHVTTARPTTSTLNSGEKSICVRIGDMDYHFMKLSGSYWYHKPGNTNPLRYNYTPSTSRDWSNEYVFRGVAYEPTTTYTSEIKYIIYSVDHHYIQKFTGNEYHSGKKHYYEFIEVCSNCLESAGTGATWVSEICSGPPCELQYTSVPDFTEIE